MEKERRAFKIEVRQADDGVKLLAGTPIVYNKKSEDMGFYEYIAPGAAKEAIRSSDPRLLYGHNSDVLLPIARKKSGTLREVEDKNGVHIEADPPKKNQFVDALIESIERGDVGEMSFGFTVLDDEWKNLDTERPTRTIKKIGEIFDYSYVAFAAYNDTTVALRSLDAAKEKPPEEKPDKIEIVLKRDGCKDLSYSFDNKEALDMFMIEAQKRSDTKPTLPASDETVPDPTIKKESNEEIDDTLDRINAAIARLEE